MGRAGQGGGLSGPRGGREGRLRWLTVIIPLRPNASFLAKGPITKWITGGFFKQQRQVGWRSSLEGSQEALGAPTQLTPSQTRVRPRLRCTRGHQPGPHSPVLYTCDGFIHLQDLLFLVVNFFFRFSSSFIFVFLPPSNRSIVFLFVVSSFPSYALLSSPRLSSTSQFLATNLSFSCFTSLSITF